jgi:hypothetical protein
MTGFGTFCIFSTLEFIKKLNGVGVSALIKLYHKG